MVTVQPMPPAVDKCISQMVEMVVENSAAACQPKPRSTCRHACLNRSAGGILQRPHEMESLAMISSFSFRIRP